MAGEIIIGTKVDTTGLEKDLQNIENKTDVEDIEVKFDSDNSVKEFNDALEELKSITSEYTQQLLNDLAEVYKEYKDLNSGPIFLESDMQQADALKQKMLNIVAEIERISGEKIIIKGINDADNKLNDIEKHIKNIGNSFKSIGKTLLKTGLLMMGIQSAMSMWRQSFNRVKEGHPELEKAMTHIQGAIDVIVNRFITRLEPYLPTILEFVDKILNIILQVGDSLLDVIFPILEGVVWLVDKIVDGLVWMYNNMSMLSYFTGTISTDTSEFSSNAEKFANNIRKANKETSKLRKQLMGFDEMNILNDDGSTGNINKIIEDINKKPKLNTNTIKDIFGLDEEPGAGDVSKSIMKWLNPFYRGEKFGGLMAEWLFGDKYDFETFPGVMGTTMGAVQEEIVSNIEKNPIIELMFGTKKENKDDSTDLEKVVKDFIFKSNQARQEAIDNFKKVPWIKAMFGGDEGTEYLDETTDLIKNHNDEIMEAIKKSSYKVKDGFYEIKLASGQVVKVSKDEFNKLKAVVDATGEAGKKSADKTKTSWDETGTSVNSTTTDMEEKGEQSFNELSTSAETNSKGIGSLWTTAYQTITQAGQIEGQKQKENSSKNTKETINNTKTQVDNYNKNPAITKVPVEEDPKKNATTTTTEIKNKVNKTTPPKIQIAVEVVQKNLQTALDKIKKFFSGNGVSIPSTLVIGYNGRTAIAKGGIINYPKLASGGIINRPGRGVPLANGGAIGGERGREAVIPLTDSGQMELLGQAIARNIIVNLTNEVKLDGKQLARYTSKAMNDMQFTSNGGVI